MQLLSVWVPYEERSTFWSIVATGESLGTMLALLAGPSLNQAFHWQSIFWVTGSVGLLWAGLFAALATARPEDHPWISNAEVCSRRMHSDHPWISNGEMKRRRVRID